jgi:hypothetical protein
LWGKFSGGGTLFSSTRGFNPNQCRIFIQDAQARWANYEQKMILILQYWSPDYGVGIVNKWNVDVTGCRNQWTHYAISRSGGVTRVFINGQQATLGIDPMRDEPFNPFATTTDSFADGANLDFATGDYYTNYGNTAVTLFGVGYDQMGGAYVDEVRYTVGVGRYTSSFTPHTEPHPNH